MRAIPASLQRWIAILLPPLAILVCCFVMMPRQKKLREVDRQIKATQVSIQDYLGKLKAISELPSDPKIATLPMTKQEQSDFLRGLSLLCTQTGNRILSITSLAPIPPQPQPANAPPQTPKVGALPADVLDVKSTVTFEGSFQSLRGFLLGLQRTRRLISMTECRVSPGQGGYPNLQTSLTITRYVDIPAPVPAAAPGVKTADTGKAGPSS